MPIHTTEKSKLRDPRSGRPIKRVHRARAADLYVEDRTPRSCLNTTTIHHFELVDLLLAHELLRTRTLEGMMVSEQGGWVASYSVPLGVLEGGWVTSYSVPPGVPTAVRVLP